MEGPLIFELELEPSFIDLSLRSCIPMEEFHSFSVNTYYYFNVEESHFHSVTSIAISTTGLDTFFLVQLHPNWYGTIREPTDSLLQNTCLFHNFRILFLFHKRCFSELIAALDSEISIYTILGPSFHYKLFNECWSMLYICPWVILHVLTRGYKLTCATARSISIMPVCSNSASLSIICPVIGLLVGSESTQSKPISAHTLICSSHAAPPSDVLNLLLQFSST